MADSADIKIIMDFLEEERLSIIASQSTKGLRAHGSSAASLLSQPTSSGGQLIDGSGSFQFQEFGRGPGKLPPFSAIYAWLELKKYGLTFADEKEKKQLAWKIMNKIRRRGSFTYIRKRPTGVLTDSINDAAIDVLAEKLAQKHLLQVASDIRFLIT